MHRFSFLRSFLKQWKRDFLVESSVSVFVAINVVSWFFKYGEDYLKGEGF